MIIDCISDLHGEYPTLKGGDLLIVAGDLTAIDTHVEYLKFFSWLHKQDYKHYIFIAGNHDNLIQKGEVPTQSLWNTSYLCDSGTEFEGLKIWGSPWTAQFPRINPKCCAFTVKYHDHTDEILNEYWKKIPEDTDILITHCPPYGILDKSIRGNEHVGSKTLREHVIARIKPKLHIFGHIHEHGGKQLDCVTTRFVNASIMNEDYDAVNKPVRIIL